MRCDCMYERMGLCTRYPKVNVVTLGKTMWVFPPADCECGEKAPKSPEAGKEAASTRKKANPASDAVSAASKAKKTK